MNKQSFVFKFINNDMTADIPIGRGMIYKEIHVLSDTEENARKKAYRSGKDHDDNLLDPDGYLNSSYQLVRKLEAN